MKIICHNCKKEIDYKNESIYIKHVTKLGERHNVHCQKCMIESPSERFTWSRGQINFDGKYVDVSASISKELIDSNCSNFSIGFEYE